MAYFGEYEKDEIVDAIKNYAKKKIEENKSDQEIIESIMEAISYGINSVMFELGERKILNPPDEN